MYKKALYLSILLATSPLVNAGEISNTSTLPEQPHHEATAGGIGLVIGAIAGGPIGALIGGSMGVMAGNQQSKSETISSQQQTINQLEQELKNITFERNQAQVETQTAQSTIQSLQQQDLTNQQQHRSELIQLADSYQLDIYFLTNSSAINQHAQNGLLKLAKLLNNNPHIYAELESHSDWRGTDDQNFLLATQRLTAVSDALQQAGSHEEQLLTTNYGEQAAMNKTSWGEELFYDRRVTIKLRYLE